MLHCPAAHHSSSNMLISATALPPLPVQTFTSLFQGRAAPHQIKHTWKLLQKVGTRLCGLVQLHWCAGRDLQCCDVFGSRPQLQLLLNKWMIWLTTLPCVLFP